MHTKNRYTRSSNCVTEGKKKLFSFVLILAKEHHYFTRNQFSINGQAGWPIVHTLNDKSKEACGDRASAVCVSTNFSFSMGMVLKIDFKQECSALNPCCTGNNICSLWEGIHGNLLFHNLDSKQCQIDWPVVPEAVCIIFCESEWCEQ